MDGPSFFTPLAPDGYSFKLERIIAMFPCLEGSWEDEYFFHR